MKQSEQINELATALSKAQAEIEGIVKDAANPFFKSKFADLASIIEGIKGPLANHGLSVSQMTDFTDEGVEFLETQINHASGQWIRGRMLIKVKDNSPQSQGSAISYCRRYALQAALNVPTIDDDGEGAQQAYRKPIAKPEPTSQATAPVKRELEAKPEHTSPDKPTQVSSIQLNRISYLINKTKLDPSKISERINKQFGKSEIKALTHDEAAWLIKQLEGVK